MKKLIAFIAIVVLSTSFAFAAGETNNFTISVTCPQTVFTNTTDVVPLGTIEAGQTKGYSIDNSVDWDFQYRGTNDDGNFGATFALTGDTGLTVTSSLGLTGLTNPTTGRYAFQSTACDATGKITLSVTQIVAASNTTSGNRTLVYTLTFDAN